MLQEVCVRVCFSPSVHVFRSIPFMSSTVTAGMIASWLYYVKIKMHACNNKIWYVLLMLTYWY